MNATLNRIALLVSILAVVVTTGCAALNVESDGVSTAGHDSTDILAQMNADSQSGE